MNIDGALETPRKRAALSLFAGIPDEYDRAGAVMGLGQDRRWRRAMLAAVAPPAGARVLDVATGTGLVARDLVAGFDVSVVGVDQSDSMLAAAERRRQADAHLAERYELVQANAERLPFADASFDALTFTYLLRYVDDPGATLRELARTVKPGGRIGMVEFGRPHEPLLRAGWTVYTRLALPPLGRAFSPQWAGVGRFLGPSIDRFYDALPLERLTDLWRASGIERVAVRPMSLGAGLVMWGVRGGERT